MNMVKFNNDLIIEKALSLAIEDGFHSISARNVAKAVGCSISPVYTAFENINELIKATKEKASTLIQEYIFDEYTETKFLNLVIGLLMFADEYPTLYKELLIDNSNSIIERDIRKEFLKLLSEDPIAQFMKKKDLDIIFTKVWFITHGLATSICSGSLNIENKSDYIVLLGEIVKDLIFSALERSGNYGYYNNYINNKNIEPLNYSFDWDIIK
ncbi:MAG: TetR/AcrR family transcriptional regulator [Candidatus Izemoplasma sp.]